MLQDRPTKARWPLRPAHTAAVVVAGIGLVAVLVGAAYVGPTGGSRGGFFGPGIRIDHVSAPEPDIDPGERIETLADAPNAFEGVPDRPAQPQENAIVDTAWLPPEPAYEPAYSRPEPTRDAPRVRVYASSGGDCTYARSRADAMVCRDGALGAADQAMRRAYDRAEAQARDPQRLRDDQSAWENARENAAIDGEGAVRRLYDLRMEELQAGY